MCLILKSNSIENLYSAKGSNRWAFAPRETEAADKALLTFLKTHLTFNSGLLGVYTGDDEIEYGALLYGHLKMNPETIQLNTTSNRYWPGEYNILIDIDWAFIRPDESLVARNLIKTILGDLRGGHYPKQISPEDFFKIIQS